MKKFVLSFICLFSFVLYAGVHAMDKESSAKKGQCWQEIYNVVKNGGGVSEVDEIAKRTEWAECKSSRDQTLRNFIRFVAETKKALFYAINIDKDSVAIPLLGILEKYKIDNGNLRNCLQNINKQRGWFPGVINGIGDDCFFLDDSFKRIFCWSAKRGFVKTIKYLRAEKSEKNYYDSFYYMVEAACENGQFKVLKYLVENTETPTYFLGHNWFGEDHHCGKKNKKSQSSLEIGCKPMEHGLDLILEGKVALGDKYGEVFKSISNMKLFYDFALSFAARNGHFEIVEYLLTSSYTKRKISDWMKTEVIIAEGIERNNLELVILMMDYEGRGLVKCNVKVLEAVSGYLKNKCK